MRNIIYKLVITVCLQALYQPVFSQLRSLESIRDIALRYSLEGQPFRDKTRAEEVIELIPSSRFVSLHSNTEIFYLCNILEQGYVLVSADMSMPEILGYSQTNYAPDKPLPDGLLYILKTYENLSDQQPPIGTRSQNDIAPMLNTSWGQGDPYNQMCPLDGNGRSQVGCVATGAAQIMKYFEWPARTGNGTINYTTETKRLKVNIDLNNTSFAWNMMKDAYEGNQFSQWEATAVSKLMYAVGAASQMDYGREESGTTLFNCAKGLHQYFGYDEDLCMLISNYVPIEMWHKLLIQEMNESRPVLFSGNSADKNVGHAFVLDGYQYRNGMVYYHVNWGWNGSCNGYYLINNMKPSRDGKDIGMGAFNDMQMMLLNFQPDDFKEGPLYSTIESETISKSYFPSGEPVSLTLSYKNLASFLCRDFSGLLCLDLYDESGQFIKTLDQQKLNIQLGMFVEKGSIKLSNAPIQDGKYTLRLSLKETSGRTLETIYHDPLPILQVGGMQEEAIEEIHSEHHSDSVFNLQGQKKQSASNHQLPAGFYLVDGKKVLIRE